MARNVAVHIIKENHNSVKTCTAFAHGINASGDKATIRSDRENDMTGYDACVLWGFITPCQTIVKKCQDKGIPWVFMDMGYWRRDRDYFKVAVNDRHSTAYFMNIAKDERRWNELSVRLVPAQDSWSSYPILIPGMSAKAAWSFNIGNESYEKQLIAKLPKYTKRLLVYRPKPTWSGATHIKGATFDKETKLDVMLKRTHCVVGHHSNVGADALVAGVPAIMKYGIASVFNGDNDLSKVEAPYMPPLDVRQQWANNAAYCQWSVREMSSGACWQFLKKDGLV